jgi:hypothetical protein
MIADVAHVGGSQQGVADGVYEHVGIAMAQQTELMLQADAPNPQFASLDKAMNIESHSYSYHIVTFLMIWLTKLRNNKKKQGLAAFNFILISVLSVFFVSLQQYKTFPT